MLLVSHCYFCFKQKPAYEMRISDWSSDVCSSDLIQRAEALYARINSGKSGVPRRDTWLPVLSKWLPFLVISQIGFLVGASFDHALGFIAAALLAVPFGLVALHWQQRGIKRLLQLASQSTSDRTEEHTSELQSLMR